VVVVGAGDQVPGETVSVAVRCVVPLTTGGAVLTIAGSTAAVGALCAVVLPPLLVAVTRERRRRPTSASVAW